MSAELLPVVMGSARTGWGVSCGGDCCRRFTLNGDPLKREEKAQEIRAYQESGGELEPWMLEALMVADMLIPLEEKTEDGRQVYGCKNLEESTGLCGVYESRPEMCRDFPAYEVGGLCRTCGFSREMK